MSAQAQIPEEEAPISVPDSDGESGKLKMIVQLVKKCFGVADIASMRLSLPASLLEPIPNLEYWHYLDRPDLFAAINDSDDSFERMLAVLRYTFTKDLKFIHGKICKPYNSVIGEHFRAHWDVVPIAFPVPPCHPVISNFYTTSATAASAPDTPSLDTASLRSTDSLQSDTPGKSPSTAATSLESNVAAQMSSLSLGGAAAADDKRVRIVYITEQVSHHPPVSAYYAACPSRGVELSGIDQISAKVSGTTIRVAPGTHNKGIYVNLTAGPGKGEQYHITHPIASVNGILRGSFYITVSDTTIITCTGVAGGPSYRTIIEYKEESWLGKAHFLLEGVIHEFDPESTEHEEWVKVKHVPQSRIVAQFDGTWRGVIRWRRITTSPEAGKSGFKSTKSRMSTSSKLDVGKGKDAESWAPLMDLSTLQIIPKEVRPLEKQLPDESRKLWETVTQKLVSKEYSDATKEKIVIEQRQRDEAAERKRTGTEFVPRYFDKDYEQGTAKLTQAGIDAVAEEMKESASYCLEGSGEGIKLERGSTDDNVADELAAES